MSLFCIGCNLNFDRSDEAPPTDPAHPFPPAAEKGKKPKARKKERKRRERGQRSTPENTTKEEEAIVNSGNVSMETPHSESVAMEPIFSDDEYESDFDDITEQLLNEISGRGKGEAEKGDGVGPPREPIEDENEWEFHHTRTAKKISTHRRSRQDDSFLTLPDSSGSEPDEDYVGAVRGLPNPEEEAAMAAQREEREMAEFRFI